MNKPFTAHFCRGTIPVAFVFSVPGAEEESCGMPVAGSTGKNLDYALNYLKSSRPDIFPSNSRYDYRITNAFDEPRATSLGHTNSEAKNSDVWQPANIRRVMKELEDCNIVVMCGNKAKLLSRTARTGGHTVIEMQHIGNKSLNSTIKVSASDKTISSEERRYKRIELWSSALLEKLEAEKK